MTNHDMVLAAVLEQAKREQQEAEAAKAKKTKKK